MKDNKKKRLANEELKILKDWFEGLPSMLRENQTLLQDVDILDKLLVVLFESILNSRRHYLINSTETFNELFNQYYLARLNDLKNCNNSEVSFNNLFEISPLSIRFAYKNTVKKYPKKDLFEIYLLVILNSTVYCKQEKTISINKLEKYISKSKPIFDKENSGSRNDTMGNYMEFLSLVSELL